MALGNSLAKAQAQAVELKQFCDEHGINLIKT